MILEKIVNPEIVLNPVNWFTIALMLAIFGFGAHILLSTSSHTGS